MDIIFAFAFEFYDLRLEEQTLIDMLAFLDPFLGLIGFFQSIMPTLPLTPGQIHEIQPALSDQCLPGVPPFAPEPRAGDGLYINPENRVTPRARMVHKRSGIMSIDLPPLQLVQNLTDTINGLFLDAPDKKTFFGGVFTDLQSFAQIFSSLQQIVNLVVVDLNVTAFYEKSSVSNFLNRLENFCEGLDLST